jgi:hypothetical protein
MDDKQETVFGYSIDLDAITEYCKINSPTDTSNKKTNEFRQQEISNNYQLNQDQDLVLAEKIVHEVITPQDAPLYDDLKVDLVKGLLQVILTDKEKNAEGLPIFTVPSLIAIQTFSDYGFIKINKQ